MSFKQRWQHEKLKKKAQNGFRRYPVATVAHYGPDDKLAAKVVVSIILAEDAAPEFVQKWFAETTDVRTDVRINSEILQFISLHAPKSVVIADRIIGCPHEEGIDYPEGGKCPRCVFWATRDRWSGEIIH